uniref:Uncharacterized protein n=1 Tax=Monodelphis domestica TaxID=13616 RepID=A0A5F8HAD3_MONDO
MRPSPLAVFTAAMSTVLPWLVNVVLSFMLAFSGNPKESFCKFTSVSFPKLSTMVKALSRPSSSLVYTTRSVSCQMWHSQPQLRSSSLRRRELNC